MGTAPRSVLWIPVAFAACFGPHPPTGVPCDNDSDCPAPQTCEQATMSCELDDGGAIDVTGGGTFGADLAAATDDVPASGCGSDGGRDVAFRVRLSAPEVYYFDTFDSSFDTTLRVYDMPCAMVGSGGGYTVCADDACGGSRSQVALSLPAGESCIVIDQAPGQDAGTLSLKVIAGTRDGQPLPDGDQTLHGDTCGSENLTEPEDRNCDGPGRDGKDVAYFFTTCPGESRLLDASICPEPSWDPVLYVRQVDGRQIGCNDDSCGHGPSIDNVDIDGSTFFFLYVDGFDAGECGDFDLVTSLR